MSLAKLWLLLACAWLAGCQSTRTLDPGEVAGDFDALGKLALRAPGETLSVRFRWRQAGERYDLELWGPFGQGRTRLVGDNEEMSVLDGRGDVVSQGRPAQVVRQQIGWDLPLLAMVSWAQGKPVAGQPVTAVARDGEGRYQSFSQAEWRVRYLAYFEPASEHAEPGVERPRTMALETGAYKLKVAFSRWQR